MSDPQWDAYLKTQAAFTELLTEIDRQRDENKHLRAVIARLEQQ